MSQDDGKKEDEKREALHAERAACAQSLMEIGDRFFPERAVGPDAVCDGRRFPWANGNVRGSVYYEFNEPSRGFWRRPSVQIMDQRGHGGIPLAYSVAAEIAMDTASSHRMYSEALGLWHSPINPVVRAQVGLVPYSLDAVVRSQIFQFTNIYDYRSKQTMTHIARLKERRARKSPYDPGESGDFHNGRPNFWLRAINGALNVFANKVEPHDQLDLKRRVVAAHDNTSWFVYDVRELGPLMNALRGYHDSAANMPGDEDIRFVMTGDELNLQDTPGDADVQATAYGICASGCSRRNMLYEDTDYRSRPSCPELSELSRGLFILDEQRALQSTAFYTALLGLSTRLHRTIDRDPQKKGAFLSPRNEHGAQEPRLNNKDGNRKVGVRLRRRSPDNEGTVVVDWTVPVPATYISRYIFEQLILRQNRCCRMAY